MSAFFDFSHTVLSFIVAISVLVAVHEYGHFAVARALGVRVLRYSIGFGPRLFGWTRGGVDYWISAIPFGGYVKMLDEREGPVPVEEQSRAFNRQKPWRRMLIVAAGPGINFLFAILAYWAIYLYGIEALRPVLGPVMPDTPAAVAGLREGDEVLAMDGTAVRDWQQLRMKLLRGTLGEDGVQLRVRDVQGAEHDVWLPLASADLDPARLQNSLGLSTPRPRVPPVLGEVLPGQPADHAGLRKGDLIRVVGDKPVSDWTEVVNYVSARPGAEITLEIERAGAREQVVLRLAVVEEGGKPRGRMGAAVDADPSLWQDWRAQYLITLRLGPVEGLAAAVEETWNVTVLTLGLLGRMVVGDVSWENISGPIQIAQFAGTTASIGLAAFLGFLGLVSVSLGVLNLLPVPLLDGGHLLFDACEWIMGRPLSERAQLLGQKIGIAFLFGLMSLALYNDVMRLLTG